MLTAEKWLLASDEVDARREQMEDAFARITAIVESSDDGIIDKTLDGIITSWNAGAERIFGYSAREMIGRPVAELIPEDRQGEEPRILALLCRGEGVDHFETVRLTKDRRRIDVSITIVLIRNSAGQGIGATKIVRDITRHKQAEAALRQRDRLIPALAAASAGIWEWSVADGAELVPEKFECSSGAFPDKSGPARHTILDLILPEDRQVIEDAARRAIDGDGQYTSEYRIRVPYGGIRWLAGRGYVIRDAAGNASYIMGITMDITARKEAEQALRASEHFNRVVLDSLHSHVTVLDAEGTIVAVNEAWTRFARENGNPSASRVSVGANYLDACRRADGDSRLNAQAATAGIQAVLNGSQPRAVLEYPCPSPAEDRWFVMTAVPLPAPKGGAIVNHFPITAQKRAQAEMVRAKETAEEANATKDLFLSTATHELRSPLAAILLWTELLRKSKSQEEREEALKMIEDQTYAQSRLVDDILDASRITHGKLQVETRPMDLAAVVRKTVDMVRPGAATAGIQMECDLRSDARAPMLGDSARVQQVITNLLINAIKFTPGGGRVQVRFSRKGSIYQIEVIDTGNGIEADFLPHVFDAFAQSRTFLRAGHGGLGLGLAIVKHLVEEHHGTVRADSDGPGRGAKFTVSLPAEGR